jgi:hypothetical protein
MVWVLEKKMIYHLLDLSFERIEIPIRVKFEFQVKEDAFVPDSLSINTLYNREAIERRYPRLKLASLERSIGKTVEKEIFKYLKECGFLSECDSSSTRP